VCVTRVRFRVLRKLFTKPNSRIREESSLLSFRRGLVDLCILCVFDDDDDYFFLCLSFFPFGDGDELGGSH
jgi:hypothetical protein